MIPGTPPAKDAPTVRARQPVIFIGHGSPMNILRDNAFTRSLVQLGAATARPEAVLVISAHWLTPGETRVGSGERPRTIHDFGGFPSELYQVRYPAPGSPLHAGRVVEAVGSTHVRPDPEMGLDHGAWSVLRHMWPQADLPVVQLSIDWNQPPQWHLELGRELGALRDQGILILGSGNVVHNLGRLSPLEEDLRVPDWAAVFDSWVKQRLAAREDHSLARYSEQGDMARLAVPSNDHYLPLLYAVGALAPKEPVRFTHQGFQYGSISMRCFTSA